MPSTINPPTNRQIEVLADVPTLVAEAARQIVPLLQQAIADRGRATIVLAGGSTPKPLYEILSTADLAWDKLHIFWGDERYVPADHPDSNYRMAKLAWLDRVNFPSANIHPMPTSANDPATDAQTYAQTIQQFFGTALGEFPQFDVMLLGMGDDAHTASLFPGTDALQVCDRLVTVGNKDGQPRITLTAPLINRSAHIFFLVAGASKQTALQQVFAPTGDDSLYPSRLIQPEGNMIWLLDQAAAEGITR
jgi:6-phosphogluconolactonase